MPDEREDTRYMQANLDTRIEMLLDASEEADWWRRYEEYTDEGKRLGR